MESHPLSAAGSSGSGPVRPEGDDALTHLGSLEHVLTGVPSPHHSTPSVGSSNGAMLMPDQQPTVISKQAPFVEKPALLPSPRDLAQLMLGKTLDHFQLTEYIGGGGMGAVFKGIDTKLGRTVAVKILSRDQHDGETKRRFKNEAQSAARLDHENIARVYYVGEADGWPYIVFEHIEGTNLRDVVLERGPLELDEAISYTLQIAEALRHAASRDVVHRDIKPSNVLITPAGKAKLVDMGLARQHQVDAPSHDLTASGVTLGTFDYISPEQANDPRSADVRSDIYSLGCTLYFILTGRPPFPDGTVLQKLISHSSKAPPELQQFRGDLPDELTTILGRMLEKQADRRYQTPDDLISDLWDLVDSASLAVEPLPHAVRAPAPEVELSPLERHLPWIVPTLLLVVMVLASDMAFPASELADAPQPSFVHAPLPRPRPAPPVTPSPPVAPLAPAEAGGTIPPPAPTPAEGASPASMPPTSPSGRAPMDPTVRVAIPPVMPLNTGELDPPVRPTAPMPKPVVPEAPMGTAVEPEPPIVIPQPGTTPKPTTPMIGGVPSPMPPAGTSPELMPTPPMSPAFPTAGSRVVIVGDGPTPSIPRFPDLAAAVSYIGKRPLGTAAPEAIIELRYNGVRQSMPVSFANQKITLRAGEGYTPIVNFVPNNDAQGRIRRAMISIHGGQFFAERVHFEFAVPAISSDSWSLVELSRPEEVQFDRCTFTIQNAGSGRSALHPDVAFFDLPAPSVTGKMMLMADGKPTADEAQTPLELTHCAARGEANFVRSVEALPFQLVWEDGLLATSEHLLTFGGARQGTRLGGNVVLQLRHVTAILGRGLVHVTATDDARHQLPIVVRCNDNIFLAPGHLPFIEHNGFEEVDAQRRLLTYSGSGNFYQANFDEPMERFWRINATDSGAVPSEMDFAQWDDWAEELQPQRRLVKWASPPAEAVPFHKFARQNFLLKSERSNPARGSAADNSDAGFGSDLPEFAGALKVLPSSPSPMPMPATATPAASPAATPKLPVVPAPDGFFDDLP